MSKAENRISDFLGALCGVVVFDLKYLIVRLVGLLGEPVVVVVLVLVVVIVGILGVPVVVVAMVVRLLGVPVLVVVAAVVVVVAVVDTFPQSPDAKSIALSKNFASFTSSFLFSVMRLDWLGVVSVVGGAFFSLVAEAFSD